MIMNDVSDNHDVWDDGNVMMVIAMMNDDSEWWYW